MAFLIWLLAGIGQQSVGLDRQRASIDRQQAAIEKQKASVRRQIKLAQAPEASFFVITDQIIPGDCPALSFLRKRVLVDSASQQTGISPDLLDAVIQQESAYKPCSVSSKGALGLMQLMPSTAERFGVQDPFDPDQNVNAGAKLLKQLLEKYKGDLNRVLGAYNAGEGRVDEAGGVPAIPETMKYVEGILGRLQKQD